MQSQIHMITVFSLRLLILLTGPMASSGLLGCNSAPALPLVARQCVNLSELDPSLCVCPYDEMPPITDAEAMAVVRYVDSHPDYKSYHLLLKLRTEHPVDYAHVPASTKASILSSALGKATVVNDFVFLTPDKAVERVAGKAIRELGIAAKPYFVGMLNDRSTAETSGSEEATIESRYIIRRCDLAYYFVMTGQRRHFVFLSDPRERDVVMKDRLSGIAPEP
jgi:hypothetical protein